MSNLVHIYNVILDKRTTHIAFQGQGLKVKVILDIGVNPCKHDIDKAVSARTIKLGTHTSQDKRTTLVPYGEILTTLFMRFKSRDPVICIFITWSRDYDSNVIDRFYTKNKKNVNYSWQSGYPETVKDHELDQHVHIL